MNRNNIALLRPMVLLFVLLNGFFVTGNSLLVKWGADQTVLIGGNLVLFAVSLASFLLTKRALGSPNPHSFVRAIYGSFIIKFFVCAVAAFVYIISVKKNVNKPALFASMGLYVVYTFMEVSSLLKLLKLKRNA